MPGNEVGDRVHNFFAHEDLSSGHHHSQVVDGSWQVLGNNQWAGSQRHIDLPSSNSKSYNLQQSDFERGQNSHSFQVAHDLNYAQSTSLGPDLARSHSQSQLPNSNGYMHGRQILQTRQNEANFLGVDTESDRYTMTSRGLSIYESQGGNGLENNVTPVRPESSGSRISFDFLGGQQMGGQQIGMLQSMPQQLSGFNDLQLLQRQAMLRKMQELQRQQQIQQLESGQHSSLNRNPSVIEGTPISPVTEASNNTWATEPTTGNKSWLHRATQAVQGSSNEFRFPSEQGQALSLMGLIPQQVDRSLYGVPISNSRGTSSQYGHGPQDKHPMQQMAMYGNSSPGNQYTGLTDQVNMQDGSSSSRQGFQGENFFSQTSGQGLNSGMYSGNLQLVNSLHRNAPVQEFNDRLELAGPSVHGKAVLPDSPSQNVVALDPTEEKILFGDDNMWDSFGNSANVGAGGSNMSNSPGLLTGFPSLQSGSWSALMQSAVAETSSNDIGLHEEWSGPSIQNTEVAVGQPSMYEDSAKQKTILVGNNLQSAMSSGSVPLSDDVNINKSYQGVPGFQQSGQKFPYEHDDRLQMDSMHRSFQQPSEEGSKWLSRGPLQKPLAEGSQIYQNVAHSSDVVVNAKSIPGSRTPQQNVSSHDAGQPYGKPNGCDGFEAVSSNGNELSRFYGNENKLQRSCSNDQKSMMYGEMSQGVHIWKAVPGPKPAVGLEQVKSAMGSTQVNREESSLNNLSGIPNSSTARVNEGTSPNIHHINYWKHAESSMADKGNEESGKFQHHMNKGPQILGSSMNSSDNAVKMQETENSERKENSSDSHHSNLSQHTSAGGSKENAWSDGSDTRNLLGGRQKVAGPAGQKAPGPRKFQYHPMGNLDEDVEPSYGRKFVTHNHSQGPFGQSKFFGQITKTSSEMEKGHSPIVQHTKKGADDSPSKGTLTGFAPNMSASLDKAIGTYVPNKAAQSSQNMLEFLQNLDQSKESGNSDGSVGPFKQNQSSSSHGFGLQLGFPSQWLPAQNRALSSQSSAQLASSLSSAHATPDIRESSSQVQSLPSLGETSEGEFKRNEVAVTGQSINEASRYGMAGNFSSALNSGFPHLRSQLQDQQMVGAVDRHASHSPQTGINQKDTFLSSGDTSQPTGISQKDAVTRMAPNAWTKGSSQQNFFGGHPHNKLPPGTFHPCQSNNKMVSTPCSQEEICGERHPAKGSLQQLVSSADLAPKPSATQGKETALKHQADASPSNSASTERDIEAFGRSLKPNTLSHQNYSLLHQMRTMKSTEIDPSNRGLKRFKGAESSQIVPRAGQSSEQNVMVGDTLVHRGAVPSGDSKLLSFSGSADNVDSNASFQLGNVFPQDVLAPSRNDSENHACSNITASIRVDHPQISPQMAPSWFNQYGTFKNGQILPMYDARKHATLKTIEQRFSIGKTSDSLRANTSLEQANAAADNNQVGNIWQRSIPSSIAIEPSSSAQVLPQDVADQDLDVARHKKRKIVATRPPWLKEVTQGSRSLLTISMAEVEWAKATNRLIDKVEDEAEMLEDGPTGLRPRRRVILTTQLMQQLFRPPQAAILSADVSSNYETVACVVARLALGDACSLIPCSESDSCAPLDSSNLLTDKNKISERISDQHLSEVTEHFIGRARKLENDFMRLDKRASVVDLRVECQDLEKVSMINRFARFHSRGQADVAGTSSSYSDAQRPPCPQKYVNALLMPRNLPERVQCLSL